MHLADDVVQVAITRLYTSWRRARAADNLDAYVRAILVRTFLNERRRPWNRVRLSDCRWPRSRAFCGARKET